MRNLLFALLLLPLMASCVKDTAQVTLDSLLDEMISVEESARYPLVPCPRWKGAEYKAVCCLWEPLCLWLHIFAPVWRKNPYC